MLSAASRSKPFNLFSPEAQLVDLFEQTQKIDKTKTQVTGLDVYQNDLMNYYKKVGQRKSGVRQLLQKVQQNRAAALAVMNKEKSQLAGDSSHTRDCSKTELVLSMPSLPNHGCSKTFDKASDYKSDTSKLGLNSPNGTTVECPDINPASSFFRASPNA